MFRATHSQKHRSCWKGLRSACLRCKRSSPLEGRQRHHRPCELVPESESGFRDRCRQNGGEASFVSAASRWLRGLPLCLGGGVGFGNTELLLEFWFLPSIGFGSNAFFQVLD